MKEPLDVLFGEMRALLHGPSFEDARRAQLWLLMARAYQLNPKRYGEQWIPYLQSFVHVWHPSRTQLRSAAAFFEASRLAPYADLTLDLFKCSSLNKSSREALLRSKNLTRLISLTLSTKVWGDGIHDILLSPHLNRLGRLTLHHHGNASSFEIVTILSSSAFRPSLHALSLHGFALRSDETGRALYEMEDLNLRTLSLHCTSQRDLNSYDLKALLSHPFCTHLEHLRLEHYHIQESLFQTIADSAHLHNLSALHLDGAPCHAHVRAEGLNRLLDGGVMARLKHFSLRGYRPAQQPSTLFKAFLQSPQLSHLQTLCFHSIALEPFELTWLAESEHLGRLHTLDLSHCVMPRACYRILAEHPFFSSLDEVVFSPMQLTPETAALLAHSTTLSPDLTRRFASWHPTLLSWPSS